MSLPDEDLWYCKQNGYYRLPEPLPDDLVDRLNTATDREIAAMNEPIVWEETDSRAPADIRRLSKILARDPAYMEAATHPPVLDALEHFLGPNIDLLTNKHNHLMVRPPNSGVVPWHTGEQITIPYSSPPWSTWRNPLSKMAASASSPAATSAPSAAKSAIPPASFPAMRSTATRYRCRCRAAACCSSTTASTTAPTSTARQTRVAA